MSLAQIMHECPLSWPRICPEEPTSARRAAVAWTRTRCGPSLKVDHGVPRWQGWAPTASGAVCAWSSS